MSSEENTPEISNLWEQLPELYDRIRMIAERELRNKEQPGHSWRPTDLTHEMLVNLLQSEKPPKSFETEATFHNYVVRVMRNLLTSHARRKSSVKRGGQLTRDFSLALEELQVAESEFDADAYTAVLSLTEEFRERDPRAAEIFLMHWHSGESTAAIAQIFELSKRTIQEELKTARAWLAKEAKKRGLFPI